MSHAVIAAVVFLVAVGSSALMVRQMIPLCSRLGLIDMPGPRRVHSSPLPRGAGAPVFLAFVLALAVTFSLDVDRFPSEIGRLALLICGSTVIVAVMLVDDLVGLRPLPKLLWQIGVAAMVVLPRLQGRGRGIVIETFNAPVIGQVNLPLAAAIIFTLFWLVGMMNTMNWVDGLDGLAGSVTLVACAVLFAHTYFWPRNDPQFTISLLPLALGGVVIGFLYFNWHPSKIILGDSGANFLGFALGVISIIGGAKIATALLALGLPILDVAWVILNRTLQGKSPAQADRGHLHHRLLDAGWSQAQVVGFVAGISAIFGMSALLLPSTTLKLAAIGALGMVLVITLAVMAWRERTHAKHASEPSNQLS